MKRSEHVQNSFKTCITTFQNLTFPLTGSPQRSRVRPEGAPTNTKTFHRNLGVPQDPPQVVRTAPRALQGPSPSPQDPSRALQGPLPKPSPGLQGTLTTLLRALPGLPKRTGKRP